MSVIFAYLQSWSSSSYWFLCLVVVSVIVNGVLKSSITIVELSIFSFNFCQCLLHIF